MAHFRLLTAAAAAALMALGQAFPAGPALARQTLTDAEMGDLRGGMLVADGIAFDFGAVVRTYEDGALALETQVTWTPAGPAVTQTPGAGVAPLTGGQLAALSALGVPYQTASGATIVQNLTSNQITNVLLNTGDNHAFRQETDVTLSLPGFAATQQILSQQALGLRLADDLDAGATFLLH